MQHGFLPYSPELYIVRTNNIPFTSAIMQVIKFDARRVFFSVTCYSSGGVVSPFLTFMQPSATANGFNLALGTTLQFTWINHYKLVQCEAWVGGGSGTVTAFTQEVLFTGFNTEVKANATRKPESLTAKIKRYFIPDSPSGRGTRYNNTERPEETFFNRGF